MRGSVRDTKFVNQRLKHAFKIAQDIVVPVANDVETKSFQFFRSSQVGFVFGVLAAVDFNDQLWSKGYKIDDISRDRNLPFELVTRKPPTAQMLPNESFRFSGILAELHSAGTSHSISPHPTLSPEGRGEV